MRAKRWVVHTSVAEESELRTRMSRYNTVLFCRRQIESLMKR